MKLSSSNKTIVVILALAALAIAFWVMMLSPKREEVSKLADQADQLSASLAESQRQVTEAEAAKREFPKDYQRLVVLGQAVPDNEETSSLLVELSRIAKQANVRFESIELESTGEESSAEAATEVAPPTEAGGAAGVPVSQTVPPTEAAASLLPLGATIGPAGLGVMPYKLSFSGSFSQIADFIAGVDGLVGGSGEQVEVEGRLVTLDGFSLVEEPQRGFPYLSASFSVTTYLTPPEQGSAAAPATTVPAESEAAPVESSESSEPAAESPTTVAEAR
ncbi:MAG TPA: type 4a pilus biogenesis protein PilO [Solirubrobacterales bacterium]|nr:type 4a pilus biogenesis protein PilO [Solirubrobacterales bacterium]